MAERREKLLAQLGEVRAAKEQLDRRRGKLAREARHAGIPVAAIAKALGMSRQGVYDLTD